MIRFSVLISCAVLALWTAPQTASAQDLLFTLNPAAQSGLPNDTLTFNATLGDLGNDTLFLNNATISLTGFGLQTDSLLTGNFPLSLNPGDFAVSDLFTVVLSANAAPGDYFGTIDIVGGVNSSASDILAEQDFLVTVNPAPTPAPSALLTALMGAVPGLLLLRRRRK